MGYWRLHQDPDLSALQSQWERAHDAGAPCVFRSFAMARHWMQAFADTAEVCILTWGEPPLILPFVVRGHQLQLIGEGLFDYQDACGRAVIMNPGLWSEAWQQLAGIPWDRLQITGVREGSAILHFARMRATPAVYARALQRPAQAPLLNEEHRRYARRWRAAQGEGVRLCQERAAAARCETLQWLLEHKAADFGADNVLDPRACRWLEAMVRDERELTELWSLRRGGRILSALLCWRYSHRSGQAVRYAYTISYDQQAAELSPGVLLLYAVVCRSGEERMGFDFLTGDQPFKRHFATGGFQLLHLRGPRNPMNACRLS